MKKIIRLFLYFTLALLDEESIQKPRDKELVRIYHAMYGIDGYENMLRRKIRQLRNTTAVSQNESALWFNRGRLVEKESDLLKLQRYQEVWRKEQDKL